MAEKKTARKGKKTQFIALSSTNKEYVFNNPLEKQIKYMGEHMSLKLYEDPEGFSYVLWKNKKYPLEIIEKKQNKYTIMLNGVWHTFTIESPFSLQRRKFLESQAGTSAIKSITAPMPGKVIEVMVEEGAEVKAGEPVIILEAMKMQNEIAAHTDGVIKKITVRANDSVMKDDVLIEIDSSAESS